MKPYLALSLQSAMTTCVDASADLETEPVPDDLGFAIAWVLVECLVQCPFIDIVRHVTHKEAIPLCASGELRSQQGDSSSLGSQSNKEGSSHVLPLPFRMTVSLLPIGRCFPVLTSSCTAPGAYAEDCWIRSESKTCRVTAAGMGLFVFGVEEPLPLAPLYDVL